MLQAAGTEQLAQVIPAVPGAGDVSWLVPQVYSGITSSKMLKNPQVSTYLQLTQITTLPLSLGESACLRKRACLGPSWSLEFMPYVSMLS